MCGRYAVSTPFQQLAVDFEAVAEDGFDPSYNLAPTDPVPVVWQRAEDEGARRLGLARWGLVPSWAKDPAVGVRAFNARVETAAEKPTFRSAFARRRCVLPADGYYEWKKGAGRVKQPMFIRAADGRPLGFAGLYERWKDAEGRALWSVTILTGPALGPLADIHDRRPLAIAPDLVGTWLDPDLREPERIRSLLEIDTVPAWAAHPVGPEVGNVRNDGPGLIREITDPGTLF